MSHFRPLSLSHLLRATVMTGKFIVFIAGRDKFIAYVYGVRSISLTFIVHAPNAVDEVR